MGLTTVVILLKLLNLGVVIAAAYLWADAGVDSRPKNRDEMTLIGGMLWSQIIIPFGLIISLTVGDALALHVHEYYLLVGVVLCFVTGAVLLLDEIKAFITYRRSVIEEHEEEVKNYDKIYLAIAILSLFACAITLAQFVLITILNN